MGSQLILFRAEWQKITGNVRAITFLVWVYPITALIFALLVNGLGILLTEFGREQVLSDPPLWTQRLLDVWTLFNRFPINMFIRMPFLAFAAVLFAGEYQWATWKNIIPRRQRAALILIKFLALGLLILIALTLTSIVWWAGGWLSASLVGLPYGPEVNADVVADFGQTFLLEAAVTFVGTLIMASYAALFAMASRSILASLLLSVGLGIVEFASAILLMLVGRAFERPDLVNLYSAMPSYNLTNVSSWISEGIGSDAGGLPGFTAVLSLPQSAVIVGLWVVGLVTLTALLFRRQDITS